ncbi:MAG: hypothetical protein HY796_03930 [Elusimicrobia bacterium]|nr:hypothetical protein [Elusimicrobiota bacterium]
MQHKIKLTAREKINIWLDLCDFSFRLMKNALSVTELEKRLKKIRQAHLKEDRLFLLKLAGLK